jgi:hypothetical protein
MYFNIKEILGMTKIYPVHEALRKVDDIISEVDFNNDGTINFSEFVTVTMKKERLLSEEMLKKAFDMFDLVLYLINNIIGWKWIHNWRRIKRNYSTG